jgi:hypothetical protein
VHAPHQGAGKPEVSFKTPTYSIGGSDYSLTRQGGFTLRFMIMALFFVGNINRKIEDLVSYLSSTVFTTLKGNQEDRDFLKEIPRCKQVGIPHTILASTK